MEIALIHNNQLILGPLLYNMRMINSELEDLDLTDSVGPQSWNSLPIHFSDGVTHLLPIEKIIGSYNSKYHNIGDFNWTIVNENETPIKVIFNYEIIDKTLDEVKAERKKEASSIRKEKENTIINVNINNNQIQVSTSREERQLLTSKLSANPGLHNFKFKDIWMEISTQDLQTVITEVDTYIQEVFDWECMKHQEIDSCSSIDDVYNIEIYPQQE